MQEAKIKLSYLERNGILVNENFYVHFNENRIIGNGRVVFEKGRLIGNLTFDQDISEELFCYFLCLTSPDGEIVSFDGLSLIEKEKTGSPAQRLREMIVE